MVLTTKQITDRLAIFQQQLPVATAVLLTDPSDITYFSGFRFLVPAEREGLLIITQKTAFLIQASFSPTIEHPQIQILMGSHSSQMETHFKHITKEAAIKKLLIDKTKLFADEYEVLQKFKSFTLESLQKDIIWQQRMVKDEQEIELIVKASQIAADAFQQLQPLIKPGVTEKQLQRLLDLYMFELDAEGPAFPTIVAFGPHSSLPHHQPTETVLEENTVVLFDFGANYEGYKSDISRTLWIGKSPDPEFIKLETIVKTAYDAVINQIKTKTVKKLKARDLDQTARDFITQKGFGKDFIHTTGHGLGLDIHEQPSLYLRNDTPLKTNMVVTVEPGIYLLNRFGYRYENTVVLTSDGCNETTLAA